MSEIGHYMNATGRLARELDTAKQVLAACAFWAASGLHKLRDKCIMHTMLVNILRESKEYAISEPGCDNNLMYDGFEYTYVPVGGWPEPEKEKM